MRSRHPKSPFFFLPLLALCGAGPAHAVLSLNASDRILVLAPHPDDDVLGCAGVIQTAVREHLPIQVVYLTNGDSNAWAFSVYHHFPVFGARKMLAMGGLRREEAIAGERTLGVAAENLIFLGYPDFRTLALWQNHWDSAPPVKGMLTHVTAVPYATAYRPGAPYKGDAVLHDLENVMRTFRPTKIFCPHPADDRPDHRALYLFTRTAVWDLHAEIQPELDLYLVHTPHWPPLRYRPAETLEPPASLAQGGEWQNLFLSTEEVTQKHLALECHRTQCSYNDRMLNSFVHTNELFMTLASTATQEILPIAVRGVRSWTVTADTENVTVQVTLNHRTHDAFGIALMSYRFGTAFATMPKLWMRAKHDGLAWTLRLSRQQLQNPDALFVSLERLPQETPRWLSLQVLVLPLPPTASKT